ncbi:MAG TPA: FAD-dependent oxidoreductase, partial [Bacteroidetes bacterium]|nr:FAD-dependent oxidoreductase [Bacteroidota bacterium]
MEKKRNLQVGIIGGGVAGLFAAWYLAREGGDSVKVSILDRGEFGHGCSWDAAGMLAPVNELEFQETELFHAGMASRKLYDQEVAADLGDIGLVQRGTVEIGLQADDTAYLQRLYAFQREHGQEVEWLSGEKLREREPFLSHHVTHGIWSWVDAQIEHRVLLQQLVKDCQKRGVALHPREEVLSWHPNESGQTIVSSKSGDFVFDKLLVAP